MAATHELRDPAASQGSSKSKGRVARVLIIDTHPIVREGFRRIIENEDDLMVCAEADTVSGACRAIELSNPDVIVADIAFRQGDGIDLVRNVRAHHPHLPILVLSTYNEAIYAERILCSGANGYMTKQATGEEILRSLRSVIGGAKHVSEGGRRQYDTSDRVRGKTHAGKSDRPIEQP